MGTSTTTEPHVRVERGSNGCRKVIITSTNGRIGCTSTVIENPVTLRLVPHIVQPEHARDLPRLVAEALGADDDEQACIAYREHAADLADTCPVCDTMGTGPLCRPHALENR